ncbi:MAG: amidase, partial [Solirubrobacterales bacterium]|nr:amidase [Solirubrobacterales bacterium]
LYLGRIAALEPRLNCFAVLLAEAARESAESADARLAAGERTPLLGVPVAVKDTLDMAGEVTAQGSRAFTRPAVEDSAVVARLREAGAVIVGKTNLPELAICGFTESEAFGVTRNPWDPSRTPGGSSGGSAAAVAAGLVAAAHASDGAGSIRIPAADCALFGLKPQAGRIPIEPAGHWAGLSVNGCVTRSVADSALFLDVIAPTRPSGVSSFAEAASRPPDRLAIAVSNRPVRTSVKPIATSEVRRAVADTEQLLRGLGHRVWREDPDWGLAGLRISTRYLGGIRTDVEAVERPELLERRTRGFGRLGIGSPERLIRQAVDGAEADAQRIGRLFERADVILMPAVGEPPIEVGRWQGAGALRTLVGMSRSYGFTAIWNHTGQPAAAVPAGFTAAGMPLSVQIVVRPGREDLLLSLAAEIEAERPWAERRPALAG